MHSERTHKRYSPSQAHRFFLCKGSPNFLSRMHTRATNPWALEGTIGHEVLEAGLRAGSTTADQAIGESVHCCNDFDKDFKAAIEMALDYVWNLMDELTVRFGDAQLVLEQPINVPSEIAPGEADGHSDICIYSLKGRIVYVIDYKHGYRAVPVEDNQQVLQYAGGVLFGDRDPSGPLAHVNADNIDTVVLVIIQPNAFHRDGEIRSHETTPAMVYDYLLQLDGVIEECEQPDAPLTPGYLQCHYCEGRASCPALEASALSAIDPAFTKINHITEARIPDAKSLDVIRLAYIKRCAPLLRTFLDDVDKQIDELIRGGMHVPGHKLVQVLAKRKWADNSPESVAKLAAMIPCAVTDLYNFERKPLTEVEKMLIRSWKERVGRKQRKVVAEDANKAFAWFTIKDSTGAYTVVSSDDPRPSVQIAAQHFGNVQGILPPPNN